MTNLQNALIAPVTDINRDLLLPNLSGPTWLNVAIGLILSIGWMRRFPPRSTDMRAPLLIDVANLIESWSVATEKARSTQKISEIRSRLLNTQFDIPSNVPNDPREQLVFVLHHLLLPIINEPMVGIKTYHCVACKHTIRKYISINYIPVNLVNGQLLLYNELATYFANSASDVVCCRCSQSMNREIQLLDCKCSLS